ncbi:hypothetical protein BCR33DRAFT_191859 [Rhizoclosmatium globosum]|uniref:Uncharacterized protein n=1 Tax=Rhizoclosmatium globosum TaxID=329046 RepID=A0A1Y2D2A9_9FUNG|nr:hypothetical protein BCR33DRAFT_191859 [Rhizoclosmatium globosum]|eukprot:ORY53264.1 hypothetical protein BCR33DRAFT_191859 [Rhizoclosmatium globosum]
MFTSGEFRVTIFDDAVLLDEPWIWERAYFHLGPERTALHRFLVTFKEPYYFSSARKRLSTHLKTLPFCSLSDLADLQFGGRYLNPLLFPDAKTSFVDTSKWMYKVGDQPFFLRFLPAKCRMHYFNVQESRDCVANKNITLMGDSTLAESVNRLIFHILDDYAEVHCPPSTATCHDRNYGEAQLETTFNHADPPSYLSHVWVPSLDVCHGFVGAWAFRDSMFSDWMRFRSSYPESCRNYEDKLGLSLETDWKRSNGVWRTLPTKEQDYLFFSSGLHDLIHWKNPEGPEYKVGNYTEWLDKALGELAGTARNKIYVTVNPKMGKVDTATEHINKIARKLAKKHGYSVIDQNGVQSHRLVGEGWGMTGDYLFDFALANAQLYLNAICPKSK